MAQSPAMISTMISKPLWWQSLASIGVQSFVICPRMVRADRPGTERCFDDFHNNGIHSNDFHNDEFQNDFNDCFHHDDPQRFP